MPKIKKSQSFLGFCISLVTTFVLVVVVQWLFSETIPFSTFEFWRTRGSIFEWVFASSPILVWGSGVTLLRALFTKNDPDLNRDAELIMVVGAIRSTQAGILEEVGFRWILFLAAIVAVQVSNFLFFGFIGFGLVEWLYIYIAGPIANAFTFGYLKDTLFHTDGWIVGAAMLSANSAFRDGHKYQGWFGYLNSWFCGMFFFWLLFHYGLIACIFIHFFYDMLIYTVRYVDAVVERALGRR